MIISTATYVIILTSFCRKVSLDTKIRWLILRPQLIQLRQVTIRNSELQTSIYLKNEEHEGHTSKIPTNTQVNTLQMSFKFSKNPISRITLKLYIQVNLHCVVL